MRKIYLIGYSANSMDNKEKFSKLLEIDELKSIGKLYVGDSSNDIEISNYITDRSILKVDSRVGDKNLTNSAFPDNKDTVLTNLATLEELDSRLTSFINDVTDDDIMNIGVVVNNIMVLSFLQNMFDFKKDGNSYHVDFLNKELLNGEVPNPIIYELVYADNGKFQDINRIAL
jgi:hypothetical protein